MAASGSIDPARFLHEHLAQASPDLLRSLLTTMIDTLMSAEADAVCGAGHGEGSAARVNHRNGYRHRDFDTRAGTLDVAIPVSVDPDRDQGVHVHDPAGLADLEHQGVGGQERVRAGVEWPGAERGHLLVEIGRHRRDLRLRQPGDPEALDQLLHPPGAHPEQIAGRDHAGQGRFGAAATLE